MGKVEMITCDRCGADGRYEPGAILTTFADSPLLWVHLEIETAPRVTLGQFSNGSATNEVDLCPDCFAQFCNFMRRV
jgi:hypothetical protein